MSNQHIHDVAKAHGVSVEQLLSILGKIQKDPGTLPVGEKFCQVCSQTKPTSEFHHTNKVKTLFRDHCKDCFNRIRREERRRLFFEALSFYSNGANCCACCGESRVEFMTFDHPNRRPKDEKLLSNGKRCSVVSILYDTPREKWPKDLQVLCYNCNLSKGVYGSCPHERERQLSTASEETCGVRKDG